MQYKILKTIEKTNYGNKFTVEKVLVQAPNGKQTEMFMRTGADFAVVIPLLSSDELVMVEQHRLGVGKLSLEFPMGQVVNKEGVSAEGQTIADTELREETGYSAGKMTFLGHFYPSPGWTTQRALFYVAEELSPGKPEPEEFEFLTVKIVKISELERLINNNNIISISTIAAFHMFKSKFAEKLR